MRILVFGATGYIGRHVTARCVADGASVTAFVRSASDVPRLEAAGVRTVIGDLDDLPTATALFEDHDAVIWVAQLMLDDERRTIAAFLDALRGGGKPFIFTSGSSLLSERTDGDWSENSYAEDDVFVPRRQIASRLEIENMVRDAAQTAIRAMVVRPPLVWGNGGSSVLLDFHHSARRTGTVCYVGRGLNVYSNVHVEDLAILYGKALTQGVAGALYHAVSGEINFRTIAETIARHLGVAARSVGLAEAVDIWGKFTGGVILPSCSRTRSPRARADLGWAPSPDRLDILEDCVSPVYDETEWAVPPWQRAPAVA